LGPSQEDTLDLNLGKLSAVKLKELSKVVDEERKRRGKRSPANHEPPKWVIPKDAVQSNGKPSS